MFDGSRLSSQDKEDDSESKEDDSESMNSDLKSNIPPFFKGAAKPKLLAAILANHSLRQFFGFSG